MFLKIDDGNKKILSSIPAEVASAEAALPVNGFAALYCGFVTLINLLITLAGATTLLKRMGYYLFSLAAKGGSRDYTGFGGYGAEIFTTLLFFILGFLWIIGLSFVDRSGINKKLYVLLGITTLLLIMA